MTDIIQIVSVMLATLIGYAMGVWHTRRALRDALDALDRKRETHEW